MKHTIFYSMSAAAFGLLLAGCESTKLAEPAARAPVETRASAGAGAADTGTAGRAAGASQSGVTTVDLARGAAGAAGSSGRSGAPGAAGAAGGTALVALPTQRVVYFDFDSFAIKDEFKPVIDANARLLTANKSRRVVVEGHTDERGGSEYNLALGQKRAEAVVRSMALLGVGDSQVEAVSFGKERPAVQGSDEAAWARNRRAELKER